MSVKKTKEGRVLIEVGPRTLFTIIVGLDRRQCRPGLPDNEKWMDFVWDRVEQLEDHEIDDQITKLRDIFEEAFGFEMRQLPPDIVSIVRMK